VRPYEVRAYGRWLFGIAAAFNILVGLSLLFLRPFLWPLLHLDPIAGTNVVMANLTGMFVALFGYAYALIAFNPVEYRAYISLGATGKLLALVCVLVPWFTGLITATLPAAVCADFVFAILFLDFLRRTRGN